VTPRRPLVLVTGSRALAGRDGAETWLVEHLGALAPCVLVTGDARGPDAWAAQWGRDRQATITRTYRLSGAVCTADLNEPVGWWARRDERPPMPDDNRALWGAWCLHRDRRMVRHVARRAADYEVTVLALRSSTSATHGTEFTVGRARAAGLGVVEQMW
jgi:hypothetical protein